MARRSTAFRSFGPCRPAPGLQRLGQLIDQERVNLFADATGDHQWIHVDPERAKAGPFGGPSPTAT